MVTYFDAIRILSKLHRNHVHDPDITIEVLSTPSVDGETKKWPDVVSEIMSDSVSSSPDADKSAVAIVHQKIKEMELDNPDFAKGLNSLSSKGSSFMGREHCEASILNLMFASEEDLQSSGDKVKFSWNQIKDFRTTIKAIGVSKRCCPVCSLLLREFSRQYNLGSIEVLGSLRRVSVCTLPPWLPKRVVDKMMSSFALDLAEILSGLDTITRKRADSRVSVESAPHVMFLVDIHGEDEEAGPDSGM